MTTYRILAILALVLVLVIGLIRFKLKLFKKVYVFNYIKPKAKKIVKDSGMMSIIYEPNQETCRFISEYSLSKVNKNKYFIAKYQKVYKQIIYFIYMYDKNNKLIKILNVKDSRRLATSKMIKLSPKTKSVNVYMQSVNNEVYNLYAIKPISKFRLFIASAFTSVQLFLILFALRHFILEGFNELQTEAFIKSDMNILSIIYLLIMAIVFFVIYILVALAMNGNFRKKGVTLYDF